MIDTVVVVAKSSTALTLSPATVGFGAPVTATAKVTTTGTPEGEVTFVVDGVSTKVPVKDGAASLQIDDQGRRHRHDLGDDFRSRSKTIKRFRVTR